MPDHLHNARCGLQPGCRQVDCTTLCSVRIAAEQLEARTRACSSSGLSCGVPALARCGGDAFLTKPCMKPRLLSSAPEEPKPRLAARLPCFCPCFASFSLQRAGAGSASCWNHSQRQSGTDIDTSAGAEQHHMAAHQGSHFWRLLICT
jgi:hypothetical protein